VFVGANYNSATTRKPYFP